MVVLWIGIDLLCRSSDFHGVLFFRKTRTCIHTPGDPPMVPTDLSQSSMLSALDRASIVYFDVRLHETALVIAKEVSTHLFTIAFRLHKFLDFSQVHQNKVFFFIMCGRANSRLIGMYVGLVFDKFMMFEDFARFSIFCFLYENIICPTTYMFISSCACCVYPEQASRKKIPILVDAEKKRDGLDNLLSFADYVVCSAKFPQASLS